MPAAMHITVLVSLFAVAVCGEKATSSSSTSPQTHNGTQATHFSVTPHQTATSNQTSNQTISHQSTLPSASDSPNVTATTTANTTSPGLPQEWEKGDLNENPGLVAVLCIFCIVFVLVLVVTTVRCIGSSSNNFKRLEDVPMNKVNEESPFARYSK
ncbi:uncharacterized protein LOC119216169 isoform X2 [Pungitius pungitius]|uniref:uncharacterized protein LOC119216169 isoform X2 n=1 Tax=Pungitius pungitius TaxID=134920 RepID=UPI0018892E6E|nr:uncharacterized protein LOC119216169 isoform X2 [Pungitius pungitius]